MGFYRVLWHTGLCLSFWIAIAEFAPVGKGGHTGENGEPSAKRPKSDGPRCELFFSELQIRFFNSDLEKFPFIELRPLCKKRPGPVPKNVFGGYKLLILESKPLAIVTFIDFQHFPFDDKKPFIVIGSPMVPNLDVSFSSPHVQSIFSRFQDENMMPEPNENQYAVLLLRDVSRTEARDLNLWITMEGHFQKRTLLANQIKLLKEKLVDMIVLGPASGEGISEFSTYWKTENPNDDRMFSTSWNLFESSPADISWSVCEADYKGFNADAFELSPQTPGMQNNCELRDPQPINDVRADDVTTTMLPNNESPESKKRYHELSENDYEFIRSHTFNHQKGEDCQEFFPKKEKILEQDSIRTWLQFEEEGSCKFSCVACKTFLGLGFRPDFKHKTFMMTKGFFSKDVYDNSDQLKKHEKSALHQDAMSFFEAVKSSSCFEEAMDTVRVAEEKEKCLYNSTMNFLLLTYTEIRSGVSFHVHEAVFKTLRLIGAKVGWLHHTVHGAHDMAMSISNSFKRKSLQYLAVNMLPFSILADASTTFHQPFLSVYIQTIQDNQPVTFFYALIYLEKGEKGKAMADALQKQVEEDSLIVPSFADHFKNYMVSIVTDGAANMVGAHNSFRTHLMKFIGRVLPNIECLNHKLDNAFKLGVKQNKEVTSQLNIRTPSDRAKLWQLTYFEGFEKSTNDFYTFYMSRGHKRWLHLLDTAEELGLVPRRIKYVYAIRWSDSHYRAIETIHHNYYALVQDLTLIQVDQTFDDAAKRKAAKLHQQMLDKTYMLVLHEFMDILTVFKVASKQFQEASSIIAGTVSIVNSVFQSMETLKENSGSWLKDFLAGCVCPGKCDEGDCTLKEYDECPEVLLNNVKLENHFDTALYYSYVRTTLYENMIKALKRYFNLEVLESFELFNPSRLDFNFEPVACNEVPPLESLYKEAEQIGKHAFMSSVTEKVNSVCKFYSLGDLECHQFAVEWRPLLACITSSLNFKGRELNDATVFWPFAMTQCMESWTPITQKLVKFVLVTPFSSSEVERGFSIMNNIKTKARSGMEKDTLDGLMRVKINGPDVENVDSYEYTIDYMKHFVRVDDLEVKKPSAGGLENDKRSHIL